MPTSQENINRWIEQSDIDYIGHYIKAWIPFNAWYNNTYPSLSRDRDKISKIKTERNSIRNGINTYMESDSQEGQEFRSYISALYYQLQQNQIDGRDDRIWFETILKERNHTNVVNNEEYGRDKYYLHRTDGRLLGEVQSMQVMLKKRSDSSTFFSYTYAAYDFANLQNNASYQVLSNSRREQIRLHFARLTPMNIETVLEHNKEETPKNYYACDSYSLRRDISNPDCYSIHICKALIEILYQFSYN